jgi:GLPGLI family protein
MGPVNSTTITNYKEKFQVMLNDFMGNKYMIRKSLDDYKKDQGDVSIKYIDGETKTIAGYKCKKAEATMKDKKTGQDYTTTVWYTEEFNPSSSSDFSKFGNLKGYPMEFETKTQQGQTMKMTVKSITKGSVADSKFDIPKDGYKVYASEEEARKDMMKNMGAPH